MFGNYKKHVLFVISLLLLVVVFFLFYLDWQNNHKKFTFAMLDIGQGDALFIESPTGTQVLIDAGPPHKILSKLARLMPPLDRSIDAIIITNPDADHIGGFSDVLKNYKVNYVFEPGTTSDSKTYQNLKNEFKNKEVQEILAKKGMVIDLGGNTKINILFPDRDVSDWTTNDGSIVARLDYGSMRIMLTGDSTIKTEKLIIENNTKQNLKSNILKVGHHGSRTSTSEDFLKIVAPSYALISDGKNNKYGHPHNEVLDLLSSYPIKVFRTDLLGTIVLRSDKTGSKFSFFR